MFIVPGTLNLLSLVSANSATAPRSLGFSYLGLWAHCSILICVGIVGPTQGLWEISCREYLLSLLPEARAHHQPRIISAPLGSIGSTGEPLTPFPDLHLLCVPRLLLSAIPQTAPSLPAARQPGIGLCLASWCFGLSLPQEPGRPLRPRIVPTAVSLWGRYLEAEGSLEHDAVPVDLFS